MIFTVVNINLSLTYVSKTTFCLKNLKILRPKVTKNLTNFHKKFCEFPHIISNASLFSPHDIAMARRISFPSIFLTPIFSSSKKTLLSPTKKISLEQ